jgi:hypothetical protein
MKTLLKKALTGIIATVISAAILSIPYKRALNHLTNTFAPLPAGTIVAWLGKQDKDLPRGWHICDGNDGTPNLDDLFLRGVKHCDLLGDPNTTEVRCVEQLLQRPQQGAEVAHIPTPEAKFINGALNVPKNRAVVYIMKMD